MTNDSFGLPYPLSPMPQIRDAVSGDLPNIVEIYNSSIPSRMATADTEPVSVESRKDWFYNHHPTSRPLWVIEVEGAIAGWLSFRSFYGRPAYHRTAELSIYVSCRYRRQGIGKQLLQHAVELGPTLGLNTLVALIFTHNQPSLQLFEKFKFERWGYLPKVAELDGMERDLAILGRRIN